LTVEDKNGHNSSVTPINIGYHAHLLGRQMVAEFTSHTSGETIELGSEKHWHFDDQFARNLEPKNYTWETGDHIQSTCIFDSTGRTEPTQINLETSDEMCWNQYRYYPYDRTLKCSGHVWTGDLSPTEELLGIAARHPEAASSMILDGTQKQTGGKPIKMTMGACTDAALPGNMNCPMLTGFLRMQGHACGDPWSEDYPVNVMQVCCTAVCESWCADEEACIESKRTTTAKPTEKSPMTNAAVTCAPPTLALWAVYMTARALYF